MHIPFLDLRRQYDLLKPELDQVVAEVMSEASFVGGERVAAFERAFAEEHAVKHCVGTGNATDALLILLKALGVGVGDEVLVPSHGWLSAAEMVSLTGARPVFVDVNAESYCMDVDAARQKVSKSTKAIIPIHLYGQMADMTELLTLAQALDIPVIEDAAQAHFASQNGKMAGSQGLAGVFSFYPSKLLGAMGDGGCITTNDDQLAAKCRAIANHGGEAKNEHKLTGLNSRLDTLQAAVLHAKLKHIDDWITARNHIAGFYTRAFEELAAVTTPQIMTGNSHNFHIYAVRAKRRNELKTFLADAGIHTEIHYPLATPFTEAYAQLGHKTADLPVSAQLQEELLSLPIFATITHPEVTYIADKIREFYMS